MLLIVSVLILIFGLAATTRTQNITVGGYYPGLIVSERLHVVHCSVFIIREVEQGAPSTPGL